MPQEHGIQQFELQISDSFPTHNPGNPSPEITVDVRVPVTLYWDLDRTTLDSKKDVDFGAARWLGAGRGQHPVWEGQLGGKNAKVGAVSWELVTEVMRKTETKADGSAYRVLITPFARLLRTFTPVNGGSPETEESRSSSSTVTGNWIPIGVKRK